MGEKAIQRLGQGMYPKRKQHSAVNRIFGEKEFLPGKVRGRKPASNPFLPEEGGKYDQDGKSLCGKP